MLRWTGNGFGGEPADDRAEVLLVLPGGDPLVRVDVEVVPDEEGEEDECPGR